MSYIIVALGSNLHGPWGTPDHTIRTAVKELNAAGLTNINCSPFYHTLPLGGGLQSKYYNVVLVAQTSASPNTLLRLAKRLEVTAGRRFGAHWRARVLDIDLIDFNGMVVGWPPPELCQNLQNRGRRLPGRLILPHPQAHLRGFVLHPLADIWPHWRHRPLDLSLPQLLARLPARRDVRQLKLPNALLSDHGGGLNT